MSQHSFRIATVILSSLAVALAVNGSAHAQRRGGAPPTPDYDAFYELGPDSLVRRGVPKGRVEGPIKLRTAVYPGVEHEYWVYVPAQYDGTTEASLMVFNDGATYMQHDGYYRAINVLDNLSGAMLPEMLRWLWRDHPVSTDPDDAAERAFRAPPSPR